MKMLILALFFATTAIASEIELSGALNAYSCSYYSGTQAELTIGYLNPKLSESKEVKKVEVLYSLGHLDLSTRAQHASYLWNDVQEVAMTYKGQGKWSTALNWQAHSRSASLLQTEFNFALRVTLEDGHVFFERAPVEVGYFHSSLSALFEKRGCSPAALSLGQKLSVEFHNVDE